MPQPRVPRRPQRSRERPCQLLSCNPLSSLIWNFISVLQIRHTVSDQRSYSNRYAELLFEVVTSRYDLQKSVLQCRAGRRLRPDFEHRGQREEQRDLDAVARWVLVDVAGDVVGVGSGTQN